MFDPALNAALQRLRCPALDGFFFVVTALGFELTLAIILGALYWAWDKRRGFRLLQFIVYAGLLNHILKEIFQMPRPFQVAPESVEVLDLVMRRGLQPGGVEWALPARTSYGCPSGHAQIVMCLWGALAFHARRRGFTIACAVIIVLTALSRLYLGVHFLGDVVAGLALGAGLLAVYARISGLAVRGDRFPSRGFLVAIGFLAPLLLFLCMPDARTARRAGLLLGLTAGYLAEGRSVRFSAGGPTTARLLRVAAGVVLLGGLSAVLHLAPRWIGHDRLFSLSVLYYGCGYFLFGLVVSWAMPWLFSRTGLAGRAALGESGPGGRESIS